MAIDRLGISGVIHRGILAGAAGGASEVIWVSFYAVVTGESASTLARGVTTAAGITALLPSAPVALGIALHMTLAMLLGIVLAYLWQVATVYSHRVSSRFVGVLSVLAAIWAFNFFFILPVISPAFVHLVPYPVSLMSKLLFGLAAAETLHRCVSAEKGRGPAAIAD